MMRSLAVVLVLMVATAVPGWTEAGSPTSAFEGDTEPTARGRIDELVLGRLKQLGITPARVCSDGVFVRRAYLDVIGTLPTAEESRQFLQDADPDKRRKLIDRLLERDEFADYWAMKWCDLLRVKSEFPIKLWPNAVQAYYRWIRTAVKENLPYDQFRPRNAHRQRQQLPRPAGELLPRRAEPRAAGHRPGRGAPFMGVRPESWPPERWSGMAAFFSQIAYKPTVEWKEEIVLFDLEKAGSKPAMESLRAAAFPDGAAASSSPGEDPRQAFADWLVSPRTRGSPGTSSTASGSG